MDLSPSFPSSCLGTAALAQAPAWDTTPTHRSPAPPATRHSSWRWNRTSPRLGPLTQPAPGYDEDMSLSARALPQNISVADGSPPAKPDGGCRFYDPVY